MHWTEQDRKRAGSDVLIGRRAIAAFLGISPRTLSRYMTDPDFPVTSIGYHRLFSTKSALDGFFSAGLQAALTAKAAARRITKPHIISRGLHTLERMASQRMASHGNMTGRRDV